MTTAVPTQQIEIVLMPNKNSVNSDGGRGIEYAAADMVITDFAATHDRGDLYVATLSVEALTLLSGNAAEEIAAGRGVILRPAFYNITPIATPAAPGVAS